MSKSNTQSNLKIAKMVTSNGVMKPHMTEGTNSQSNFGDFVPK